MTIGKVINCRINNGLGNLLIGYDEENTWTGINRCSDGAYYDQVTCEAAGAVWSNIHKSGSHYLVLGSENNYSQYGGLVAGYQNFAIRAYAIVTGGEQTETIGIDDRAAAALYEDD